MADFITLTTLAEKLSLSKQTVTKMVRNGELPQPIRIGRSQRWTEAQLTEWITGQQQPANNER